MFSDLYPDVAVPKTAGRRVSSVQYQMARTGHHRSASAAGLIIAATTAHHGLTVLHDDADYRTVARHAPDMAEHNIHDTALPRGHRCNRPLHGGGNTADQTPEGDERQPRPVPAAALDGLGHASRDRADCGSWFTWWSGRVAVRESLASGRRQSGDWRIFLRYREEADGHRACARWREFLGVAVLAQQVEVLRVERVYPFLGHPGTGDPVSITESASEQTAPTLTVPGPVLVRARI
jgi:hypothetical protein